MKMRSVCLRYGSSRKRSLLQHGTDKSSLTRQVRGEKFFCCFELLSDNTKCLQKLPNNSVNTQVFCCVYNRQLIVQPRFS